MDSLEIIINPERVMVDKTNIGLYITTQKIVITYIAFLKKEYVKMYNMTMKAEIDVKKGFGRTNKRRILKHRALKIVELRNLEKAYQRGLSAMLQAREKFEGKRNPLLIEPDGIVLNTTYFSPDFRMKRIRKLSAYSGTDFMKRKSYFANLHYFYNDLSTGLPFLIQHVHKIKL